MTGPLLHAVFLKMNELHNFLQMLKFLYFELIYMHAEKKIIHPFAIIKKKKKFVQNIFYSWYCVAFCKLFVKKCINDKKSKLFYFGRGKWLGKVHIVPKRFKFSFA